MVKLKKLLDWNKNWYGSRYDHDNCDKKKKRKKGKKTKGQKDDNRKRQKETDQIGHLIIETKGPAANVVLVIQYFNNNNKK